MRGGFRQLRHPGTPAHLIDVEGTRLARQRWHAGFRRRQAELDALRSQPIVPIDSEADAG